MGIFNDDKDRADSHGCPIDPGESPVFEHGLVSLLLVYILRCLLASLARYYTTAACAAFTLISSVALILLHLKRSRVPKEQRQIVNIVFTPAAATVLPAERRGGR